MSISAVASSPKYLFRKISVNPDKLSKIGFNLSASVAYRVAIYSSPLTEFLFKLLS
jgi:hypothetical protein